MYIFQAFFTHNSIHTTQKMVKREILNLQVPLNLVELIYKTAKGIH